MRFARALRSPIFCSVSLRKTSHILKCCKTYTGKLLYLGEFFLFSLPFGVSFRLAPKGIASNFFEEESPGWQKTALIPNGNESKGYGKCHRDERYETLQAIGEPSGDGRTLVNPSGQQGGMELFLCYFVVFRKRKSSRRLKDLATNLLER